MSYIKLIDIKKQYGKGNHIFFAINNLNLEIEKGEMIAIMGPSGAGKSTLLNILGCIDTPTSGSYILSNQNIESCKNKELCKLRNKKFGFVFQYFALLKEYNVLDNVLLPLASSKLSRKAKRTKAIDYLKRFGVEDQAYKKVSELSGGQQQRVAIARALINEPDIILADEPTGALDQSTGKEIMEELCRINKTGKTIIIVTHDYNVASYCHRTVRIIDGRIEESIA